MTVGALQTTLFEPGFSVEPLSRTKRFCFVDLFAGIGGFRLPLERLGGRCLGYAEIDKEAIAVYHQNFLAACQTGEENFGDVSRIDQLPVGTDLVAGGVPCQAWSIAGKTLGFDDPRGKLWFDVCRLVRQSQPKAFLFENVKGLTEPRHRNSLDLILYTLRESGYCVYWTVLNSYDFGLPQDRDRLFLVGLRQDLDRARQFQFPARGDRSRQLSEVLEDLPEGSGHKRKFSPQLLFGEKIPAARGRFQKVDELNDFFLFSDVRDGHSTIHSWELIPTSDREKVICLTLLKNRRKKKYGTKDGNPLTLEDFQALIPDLTESELWQLTAKKILRSVNEQAFDFENSKISTGIEGVSRIFLPNAKAIGTLTASGTRDFIATEILPECEPSQYKQKFITTIYRPRKFRALSAQDYAKLQGFPETFELHPNSAIAKRQLGNAVSIPVIYELTRSILQCL